MDGDCSNLRFIGAGWDTPLHFFPAGISPFPPVLPVRALQANESFKKSHLPLKLGHKQVYHGSSKGYLTSN